MMRTVVMNAGLALAAGFLVAQSPSEPLQFEVASIKPSAGDERRVGFQIQPGGGFRAMGANVKLLIGFAYDVRDFQISGGPGWINSDRYDILAKAERAASSDDPPADPRALSDAQRKTMQEQLRERVQALLADRFQLKIHRESKEAPVYALLVGKNGPKFKPSEIPAGVERRGPMLRMSRSEISGQGVQLDMLATTLSNLLGRPVIDRTDLKGAFDIALQWTPDPGQAGAMFGGPPPPGVQAPPPPDPNGPSIFTAVQEQLGLRLESQKGPVEMIVIDRVEKPSDN